MGRSKAKYAGSEEEAEAARDFVMARIGAARANAAVALENLDSALLMFVVPDTDKSGKKRAELLELADDALGVAATAVHAAQELYSDVDPKMGEPEIDEDDDDLEDEDDDDDDDDEDDD